MFFSYIAKENCLKRWNWTYYKTPNDSSIFSKWLWFDSVELYDVDCEE